MGNTTIAATTMAGSPATTTVGAGLAQAPLLTDDDYKKTIMYTLERCAMDEDRPLFKEMPMKERISSIFFDPGATPEQKKERELREIYGDLLSSAYGTVAIGLPPGEAEDLRE